MPQPVVSSVIGNSLPSILSPILCELCVPICYHHFEINSSSIFITTVLSAELTQTDSANWSFRLISQALAIRISDVNLLFRLNSHANGLEAFFTLFCTSTSYSWSICILKFFPSLQVETHVERPCLKIWAIKFSNFQRIVHHIKQQQSVLQSNFHCDKHLDFCKISLNFSSP